MGLRSRGCHVIGYFLIGETTSLDAVVPLYYARDRRCSGDVADRVRVDRANAIADAGAFGWLSGMGGHGLDPRHRCWSHRAYGIEHDLRHMDPLIVSVGVTLEPVLGVIDQIVLATEWPGPWTVLGGTILLIGLVLVAHCATNRAGRGRFDIKRSMKTVVDRVVAMKESPWVLVTNDDGIEALASGGLVCGLHEAGINTVVVAPARNQSATGTRLTLGKLMEVVIGEDLNHTWGLNGPAPVHLIQLDGTPCDCAIVALDGGLDHLLPGITPSMMVSGINLGPNLSQDSYHSGTMAATAKRGCMATSDHALLSSFQIDGMDRAVKATLEIVLRALGTVPNIPVDLLRRGSNSKGEHRSNGRRVVNDLGPRIPEPADPGGIPSRGSDDQSERPSHLDRWLVDHTPRFKVVSECRSMVRGRCDVHHRWC